MVMKMSNPDLVTTIVTIILTFIFAVLGFLSKKNAEAKIYYESFIKVEEKIKELCILAEKYYKKGDQKKKCVITNISIFLMDNNIQIKEEIINQIIESVISISKSINTVGQSSN